MSSNVSAPPGLVTGSQSPSVELLPDATGDSSLAAECVDYVRECGIDLDPWQEYCLRTSLLETGDALWSAFVVGIIVGRQNGKGTLLEAREIAGLFHIGESLILHSAHEFKTCYEHFLRVVSVVESCPELDRRVQKIRRGVGEQAIELTNGNRLRFIARSSGSGRGMSAPCVVLDEAMFLTEAQIGAIMPTLSAQDNPQLWVTSSAPLATSVPLHRLRQSAVDRTADRMFWAEWGNEDGADFEDIEAIARANPALGRRLFLDFVETERQAMAPGEFARERMGIPETPLGSGAGPIDSDRWFALIDGESRETADTVRLALDAPPDRRSATFATAGRRPDGLLHVQTRLHVDDPSEVVRWARDLCAYHGDTPLIVASGSPALAWRAELEEAGVKLDVMPPAEVSAALGFLLASIDTGNLRHRGSVEMTNAVAGLAVKASGDVETPTRRSSSANIAPIIAAMCALYRVPTREDDRVPIAVV